jgi:hypothetical protein
MKIAEDNIGLLFVIYDQVIKIIEASKANILKSIDNWIHSKLTKMTLYEVSCFYKFLEKLAETKAVPSDALSADSIQKVKALNDKIALVLPFVSITTIVRAYILSALSVPEMAPIEIVIPDQKNIFMERQKLLSLAEDFIVSYKKSKKKPPREAIVQFLPQ